jgi:hypothetical protein
MRGYLLRGDLPAEALPHRGRALRMGERRTGARFACPACGAMMRAIPSRPYRPVCPQTSKVRAGSHRITALSGLAGD